MATKNNPGKYDCYTNAGGDEPIFVLRATDDTAPDLIRMWAAIRDPSMWEEQEKIWHRLRAHKIRRGIKVAHDGAQPNLEKIAEAVKCSNDMEAWLAAASVNSIKDQAP